jgi:photosystem II stability/assembly factor-like uncharacterized protein
LPFFTIDGPKGDGHSPLLENEGNFWVPLPVYQLEGSSPNQEMCANMRGMPGQHGLCGHAVQGDSTIMKQTRTTTIIAWVLGLLLASPGVSGAHHVVLHSGPFQAIILAIAIHPQNSKLVFLGSFGRGVFQSKDGGKVWVTSNTGLENLQVQSLAIDPAIPSSIYAGTDAGVFKSTDAGEHWKRSSKELADRNIRALAIDPSTPTIIYAGTGAGVFKSSDGGASWTATSEGLSSNDVRALVISPQDPRIVYAATFGGVFKSSNGGVYWTSVSAGLEDKNIRTILVDAQRPSVLYAGAGTQGIFKSNDAGASWRPISQEIGELHVMALAMVPSSSKIYAGTTSGLLKSENHGSTWEEVEPDSFRLSITSLATDPRTLETLYVGTGGLLFKSVDGGQNWSGVKWVIHPDLPFQHIVEK